MHTADMSSIAVTNRQLNVTGRQLFEMRRNLGLSPEQLGYRVGCSGRTIRRIEEGKRPTIRTMFLLAQAFEREVAELWPIS